MLVETAVPRPITWSLRTGILSWAALIAGALCLLRTTKAAKTGWELFAVFALALLPTVLMSLTWAFHPEDCLAMGLGLTGIALARRGRFVAAGLLFGLALLTQQLALLIVLPVLVLLPVRPLLRVGAGVAASLLVVLTPSPSPAGAACSPTSRGSTSRPGQEAPCSTSSTSTG
jgi:uncharacterized membrane protein